MSKRTLRFFFQDIDFVLPQQKQYKKWINAVFLLENIFWQNLNYIFCSDNYLLGLNKKHLHHNTLTDIITFDTSENPQSISADIFISVDRVKENAIVHNELFYDELRRVMAHGILHLFGYNDKTTAEKKIMREKEVICMGLFHVKQK